MLSSSMMTAQEKREKLFYLFSKDKKDVEVFNSLKDYAIKRLKIREIQSFFIFILNFLLENVKSYSGLLTIEKILADWKQLLQKFMLYVPKGFFFNQRPSGASSTSSAFTSETVEGVA